MEYVDNNYTERISWDRARELHYKKIADIKKKPYGVIDNRQPECYAAKKMIQSARAYSEQSNGYLEKKEILRRENERFVTRLYKISSPRRVKVRQVKIKSMMEETMRLEELRISKENCRLAQRLNKISSVLDHKKLKLEYDSLKKYKALMSKPKVHTARMSPKVKSAYLLKKGVGNSMIINKTFETIQLASDEVLQEIPLENNERHSSTFVTEDYVTEHTLDTSVSNSPEDLIVNSPVDRIKSEADSPENIRQNLEDETSKAQFNQPAVSEVLYNQEGRIIEKEEISEEVTEAYDK